MNINLPDETVACLAHYVTQGEFASLEEAAQQILAEYVAARESEDDPELEQMLDEGLAQIERGEVVTWQEYRAQADALLASFKTKA